jgi:tetratricopeptide (TPR) repeat protein
MTFRWEHEGMSSEWQDRVDQFWASVDGLDEATAVEQMRALVAQHPTHDPVALFEWASVHDYIGREDEAIPLYEAALEHGLAGRKRREALIQLSSSLRLVGRTPKAVAVLTEAWEGDELDGARAAFLALALRDEGDQKTALRVALNALAKTLPQYGSAVERYSRA